MCNEKRPFYIEQRKKNFQMPPSFLCLKILRKGTSKKILDNSSHEVHPVWNIQTTLITCSIRGGIYLMVRCLANYFRWLNFFFKDILQNGLSKSYAVVSEEFQMFDYCAINVEFVAYIPTALEIGSVTIKKNMLPNFNIQILTLSFFP